MSKVRDSINVLGTSNLSRYDKQLAALDVKSIEYTTDEDPKTVIYTGDDDADIYYRDVIAYNTDGDPETVEHFYKATDLDTPQGTTTITYTDGKQATIEYTE